MDEDEYAEACTPETCSAQNLRPRGPIGQGAGGFGPGGYGPGGYGPGGYGPDDPSGRGGMGPDGQPLEGREPGPYDAEGYGPRPYGEDGMPGDDTGYDPDQYDPNKLDRDQTAPENVDENDPNKDPLGTKGTASVGTIVQAKVSLDKTYERDVGEIFKSEPHDTNIEYNQPRIFYGVDPTRHHWTNRVTYMLALCTSVVTLRNIFRFPMLAHIHGIQFVIVYLVFMLLIGFPLHVVMITIGIYVQRGLVKAWDALPIARGIGWAMFALALLWLLYFSIYGAYALLYFGHCFEVNPPWRDYENKFKNLQIDPFPSPIDYPPVCQQVCGDAGKLKGISNEFKLPPDGVPGSNYFTDSILRFESFANIWVPAIVHYKLIIALTLTWAAGCLIVCRGVFSIGRLIFILLPALYFIGVMLFVASFLLYNNEQGLSEMVKNRPESGIKNIYVWRVALEQVLLELGIAIGAPIIYGSFCNFPNRILMDSGIVCAVSVGASIISWITFFCAMGNVKFFRILDWVDISFIGNGIVYIIYSEAFSNIGLKIFWCYNWALYIFLATVSTLIPPLLVVTTVLYESRPKFIKKELFLYLALCAVVYAVGIYFCFCKAYYIAHFLEFMPAVSPVLIIVSLFVIAILIYGVRKYAEDTEFATDWYPWTPCQYYLFAIPVILFLIFIVTLGVVLYKFAYDYKYSTVSTIIGWVLFAAIIIPIPIRIVIWILYCFKSKSRRKCLLRSKATWGPKHILGRFARARFTSER